MSVLKSLALSLFTILAGAAATQATAQMQLIIVEQAGCVYCQMWDAEIAPAYPNTAEGQFAPLVRADLHEGPPEGFEYARRVTFTPTFILVDKGEEVARMEGYPGDDFFWPLLSQLLVQNSDFNPDAPAGTVSN